MACFSREEGHTSLLLEVRNHTAPDGQIIQVDKVVKYFWKKVLTLFAACFLFLSFFLFSCDFFLQCEVQSYMASQYAVTCCSHFRVTRNSLACDVLSDHSSKHASGHNYVIVASAVVSDIMASPITPIFGIQVTQFRSCVRVEVAVLGSPS